MNAINSLALLLVATSAGAGRPKAPAPASAGADSVATVVANRVVLDIAAPASLIWTYLPSIRKRPNIERVSLNGLNEQFGARNDYLYRDSPGKVFRHDRVDVLHWEPGVRYVALVNYMPPAEPTTIIYSVDLHEVGGITHFVMDSYATVKLPGGGTESERVARVATDRQGFQDAVMKGYQSIKAEIEAAVGR